MSLLRSPGFGWGKHNGLAFVLSSELLTNEEIMTEEIEAAKVISEIYFEIAAEAIGEERVRELRDKKLKQRLEAGQHETIVIGSLPDDEEIDKWVKDHGYYGYCTSEYHEGLEEGAKWMRDLISNDQ